MRLLHKKAFYWSYSKMNFVFMNNNTLVCRFKSNFWPYFIVDDFEAVYSAQKDSLSNERLEQSDRPLRTSFSWLFSVFSV